MSASAGPATDGDRAGSAGGGAVVLVGFMGAGKSTAARALAGALGGRALDSDELLEERLGHSIAEEFQRNGEAAFRSAEEKVAGRLLEQVGPSDVLALGGGAVESPAVRAALAPHLTVLLDVGVADAWERAAGPARPLARDPEAFAELHRRRRALYDELADAIVPTGDPGCVLRALPAVRRLARLPKGTRLLWATTASREYPVLLGRGLLAARAWPTERPTARRFAVADETVAQLHSEILESMHTVIRVPGGEASKTLSGAERVWGALAEAGMTRGDELAAVGGGVVGDLAGFCAATYQRGVDVVHVPTTLVAQVDSAYGGKTGVDLPGAKNYVGAYHQPAGVLVDPDTLRTLPEPELAAGWAEVIKTGLIAGGELWERVLGAEPLDDSMILACARVKLGVVASDERDAGPRHALNLGHTVAHAIEAVTGYRRYRHGEAVALGLLVALRLSALPELREQVRGLLSARGLPTRLADADPDAIVTACRRDKKRVGGEVAFVLLEGPGRVRLGARVAEHELRGAVKELL